MRLVVVCLALITCQISTAADLTGRVIRVVDGDTFTLRTDSGEIVQVRLAEIDAPERGQIYGNRSRKALDSLIGQFDVSVTVQTTDRYGRTVGRPYVGDTDNLVVIAQT